MKSAIVVFLTALIVLACAYPPLPGLDKIGLGYDILYGTFRNQVMGYTYNQNKTWTNPNHPELVYAVPDQINVVTFPESSITKTQSTSTSTTSYARTLAESAGLSFGYGMFSLSASVNVAKKYIESSSSTSTYTSTTQRLGLWQVTTIPPFLDDFKPSLWFEQGLKSLPSKIESEADRLKYFQFVKYFGTHYLNEVEFGGAASLSTAVNVFVYEVDKQETINVDIQTEFYAKLSGHWNESIQYKSKLFKDYHISELSMIGGNPEVTVWDKWIETVKNDPTIMHYKLGAISDLIKDDEEKKATMEAYLATFFATGFKPASCQELKNSKQAPDVDGEYTVYYQNSATKPFKVYCHNMATPVPQDYISVIAGRVAQNKDQNFGSTCSAGSGSICQTYYSKLRIDPYTLFLDLNDQTFTKITCQQGGQVSTAFATHIHCQCHGSFDDAAIDLTGTALTIDPSVNCKAAVGSSSLTCAIVGNQVLRIKGNIYDNQCAKLVPRSPSSDVTNSEKFAIKLNVVDSGVKKN